MRLCRHFDGLLRDTLSWALLDMQQRGGQGISLWMCGLGDSRVMFGYFGCYIIWVSEGSWKRLGGELS